MRPSIHQLPARHPLTVEAAETAVSKSLAAKGLRFHNECPRQQAAMMFVADEGARPVEPAYEAAPDSDPDNRYAVAPVGHSAFTGSSLPVSQRAFHARQVALATSTEVSPKVERRCSRSP